MKLVKNYFLFILSITIVFGSCTKEDIGQNSANTIQNSKTFAIYDINGKQCQYLEPSLLKTIQKDLISKGEKAKASVLMEQYDNITGVLKSSNFIMSKPSENEFGQESILKSTNSTVEITGQGHIQSIGWEPLKVLNPNNYLPNPGSYVGTVGQSLRLEAFIMNYSFFDPNTCPKITFGMKNGYGVWKYAQWGQICGTTGQGLANYQVTMHLTQPPSGYPYFQVWYKAHNKNNGATGWGPWYGDSQIAGTNERLEAVTLYITTMY